MNTPSSAVMAIKGRYLITGVAATGKSTICSELLRRGLPTQDIEALGHWVDRQTGKPINYRPGDGQKVLTKIDRPWKVKELEELLEKQSDIIVCGLASNQSDYYSWFTKIFLLAVDEATLRVRLANRTYQYAFGTDLTERKIILSTYEAWQEKTKAQGAIVIDATCSLSEAVDNILAQIQKYEE